MATAKRRGEWVTFFAVASAALGLLGCGGGNAITSAPLGEFTVEIGASKGSLTIRDGSGRTLYGGRPEGISIGSGIGTWEHLYGAFQIVDDLETLAPATHFSDVEATATQISFALQNKSGKTLGTAQLTLGGTGELIWRIDPAADAATSQQKSRIRLQYDCAADEHFVGMGGQSFDVDHRGQIVPIWVTEDGLGKRTTDDQDPTYFVVGKRHTTHTPLPVYLSSAGYGLYVDTAAFSRFDFCATNTAEVRVDIWDRPSVVHLFGGPAPLTVLEHMTATLGRPALPPAYAFAPWLDAIFGSTNVRRVAHKLRDLHVPSAVIWTEDWRGGMNLGDGNYGLDEKWEVDRTLYPDLEAVAAELDGLGFRFLTYHNSFLDTDSSDYAETAAAGYTIKDATNAPLQFVGIRFLPTTLLDLSNADARAWAKQKIRLGFTQGCDGHMADFGEWLPPEAVLASGQDANFAHNQYPVEWARVNKEAMDEQLAVDGKQRLFFVRSAYLGSQSLVSVVWAGDQQTDFTVGDGFPSVVPIGIGLGIAGFPYFAHDIGGYMSELTVATTRELWFRWVTLGALSPVMRTHHGRAAFENYNWESDDDSIAHFARWAKLHMRLFPYLYGMASRSAATGAPMFAPLAIAHPDFVAGWTRTDQFMLGDRIYVAPVLTEGALSRQVALPTGRYYPLLGGAGVDSDGVATLNVDVPLGEIAAFVAAGTVLALLPDDVETTEKTASAKTLDQAAQTREVWLWAGGDGEFTEAGGLSYKWTGTAVHGTVTAAKFAGVGVSPTPDPSGDLVYDVVGPGALVITSDGASGTLTIDGNADRHVRVRVRGR